MRIKVLTKILAAFFAASTVAVASKFAIDLTLKPKEYNAAAGDDVEKHDLGSDGSSEEVDKLSKSPSSPGPPPLPLFKTEPGLNNCEPATVDSSNKSFQINSDKDIILGADNIDFLNPTQLQRLQAGLLLQIGEPYFLYPTQLQRPEANKIRLQIDKILNKHADYCNGVGFVDIIYVSDTVKMYDSGIWADDHSYRQGDIYRYLFSHEEILDLANELREFANDGRTRKEVARVIATMSDWCPKCGKSLSWRSNEKFLPLADLLEHCADSTEAQPYVANAIGKMVEGYSFGRSSEKELDSLAKILEKCANSEQTQPYVSNAIGKIAKELGLSNRILKLADILEKCANSEKSRPYVANAIGKMVEGCSSGSSSEKEFDSLAKILEKCADSEQAQPYVANAVCKMVENYSSGRFSEEEFDRLAKILTKCAASEQAQPYVAKSVGTLARKGLFQVYLFKRPVPSQDLFGTSLHDVAHIEIVKIIGPIDSRHLQDVSYAVDSGNNQTAALIFKGDIRLEDNGSEIAIVPKNDDRHFFDFNSTGFFDLNSNDRHFAPCETVCMMGPPPDPPIVLSKYSDALISDLMGIHQQGVSFAVDFGNNQTAPPIFEEDIRSEDINNEIIEGTTVKLVNIEENIALEEIESGSIRPENNWREVTSVPENGEIIEGNEINEIRENLGLEIAPPHYQ